MKVSPYLNFNGQCKEAFTFYQECIGGTIEAMMTHKDMPETEEVSPEWGDSILHATLNLGSTMLLGSDRPPGNYSTMTGTYVALMVESVADAERIFNALAEQGQIQMPMAKTFWSERFGMLTDRFGTQWMIDCQQPCA